MRVQAIVDGLAEKRIASAHRVKAYGSAAFEWGRRRGKVDGNPFTGVKVEGREQSRDRVLSERELGEAWRAAAGVPYPFGPFVQMLLLTLQRRGEVAGMRWSELSSDRTVWTLPAPRAKNRKVHLIHLTPEARTILATVPQLGGDALVFSSDARPRVPRGTRKRAMPAARPASEARAVSGFSDAMEQMRAAIEAERKKGAGSSAGRPVNWRFHDFRRTGVTTLARLGFPPHVADKILNHSAGAISGVAAVYQRHAFEAERGTALEAWAAHILKCALPRRHERLNSRHTAQAKAASAYTRNTICGV